jgi:hypothetical protein
MDLHISWGEVQKQNTQIYSQQYMFDKFLYLENNFISNLLVPFWVFDMGKFFVHVLVVEVKEVLFTCLPNINFFLANIDFLHYFRPEILQ